VRALALAFCTATDCPGADDLLTHYFSLSDDFGRILPAGRKNLTNKRDELLAKIMSWLYKLVNGNNEPAVRTGYCFSNLNTNEKKYHKFI
jgi:hypothetical protein